MAIIAMKQSLAEYSGTVAPVLLIRVAFGHVSD